ncbi:MAG: cytochrome c oxidase assembly protein [Nocardioidaceae bacterium]
MPSMLPRLTSHVLATTWQLHPLWTLVVVVALAAYAVGFARARRHGARVSVVRAGFFGFGLALLLVTVSSAVDVYAMALFWMHMIEHLMLIMVVPTFLVLGHPLTVLRGALTRPERFDATMRTPVARVLTHPAVGLAVYAGVIVGTHLTGFMDRMAEHSWLMGVEQVAYLVSGLLQLLPLAGNEPIGRRFPYLFRIAFLLFAMVPDTLVGIVLMQTATDPFPVMTAGHPAWAPGGVADAHVAGALMWAGGDGLMMFLAFGAVFALLMDTERKDVLGTWLEQVRGENLRAQVARGTGEPDLEPDVDVDDDDAMLDAYNRMLGRLSQGEGS